ncbi:MAG: hypothetical protein IPG59_00945 [Candidatus Melainabacteria bacterium]|nr:MAG: hypothetical protein IPG59_00945 [Candidatus Melainabacteria bacterium]
MRFKVALPISLGSIYIVVLFGLSALPSLANDSVVLKGKSSSGTVDLSTKESRRAWLKSWLNSTEKLFSTLSSEEAAELSNAIISSGIKTANEGYARMSDSQRISLDDNFYNNTIGTILPPGDYLGVPLDGSPPFGWSNQTTMTGKRMTEIPASEVMQIIKSVATQKELAPNPQPQQTVQPQPTSQTQSPEVQARIAAYYKWRNSWRGRCYAASMSASGFHSVYDPITGAEKWIPKNAVGIYHY